MKEYIVNRDTAYEFEMGRFEELQELIRCKDCKHCHESEFLICGNPKQSYWCEGKRNLRVEPEDYCSWAERKEE